MTDSPNDEAIDKRIVKGVGRRFIYALLGVLAVVIALFACLAVYFTLSDAERKLERTLENHLNLSSVGLRSLLWNLDNDAIEDVIEALFLEADIAFVRVEADGERMAEKVRSGLDHNDPNRGEERESLLVGVKRIEHPDSTAPIGTIEIGMSRGTIRDEVIFEVSRIVVLTLAMIAAVLITTVLVSRKYIALPLRKLQRSADHIARGELTTEIDAGSTDEIGLLARDLNTMRNAILHRNALLEDANLNLEQRVQERTDELAGAVAEIKLLNQRLAEDNQRMSAELDITRRIQEMLLPGSQELRRIEALDIAAHMEAASEVGGDYYDVLQEESAGHIKFGIGDVTGHGLESGIMAVMTQCVVRTLFTHGESDPVRFLDTLNRVLYDNVMRMGSDKNLSLAVIDYEGGTVRISGQHESVLVVRSTGEVEEIDTVDLGFPIALDKAVAPFVAQAQIHLSAGDGFVLYTDGITEAENSAGEHYGLYRLREVLQRHWSNSAEDVKRAVLDDLARYIGERFVYDDITVVVVKQR